MGVLKRRDWLSVTPEPERELPLAVATLRGNGRPTPAAVESERAAIERLLLRGTQRRWLAYLRSVAALIDARAGSEDPAVAWQRDRALQVLANHHNLLLALAGPGARLTAADRDRLNRTFTATPTRSKTTTRARTV